MTDHRSQDSIADESAVVALIPGDGWRVAFSDDDGQEWSQRLVGWGLRVDGCVVPLDTDSGGIVEDLTATGGTWHVYHPDEAKPRPVSPVADGKESR